MMDSVGVVNDNIVFTDFVTYVYDHTVCHDSMK
jgi:hypothetical protein